MKLFLLLFFSIGSILAHAQKIDSICFHLYTDSLKKGVYNYINVDGKLSDGSWRPLTSKEINFSSSAGRFEGNSLILDTSFKEKNVAVKAILRENPLLQKEILIYLKTKEDDQKLKTLEEVMGDQPSKKSRKKKNIQ